MLLKIIIWVKTLRRKLGHFQIQMKILSLTTSENADIF